MMFIFLDFVYVETWDTSQRSKGIEENHLIWENL